MLRKQILMGAAIAVTAWVVAGSAEASCKQGFCVSGYDAGNGWHGVEFTTSLSNYTHFNVWNGEKQFELGRNQRSFSVRPIDWNSSPLEYVYKIQACSKSMFSGSNCTPWVTFRHTEPR